jgi:N6-adenosine-specific RNA methylase IME4
VLPTQPFRCIVADPAWSFGDKLPGKGRGAEKHYDVMSVEGICALALPPIADDAHLFLWRVSSQQQEALDVAKAWGFTVKSELVWLKRTKTGKRHFGMGRHVRLEHEVCLICTRGKGAGILNRSTRSTFTTGLYLDDEGGGSFEAATGRHSQKPDEFFDIVESLVPGPRLELFARAARTGWTTLGNEVPGQEVMLVGK